MAQTTGKWQVTQCFGGNHEVEELDGDVVTAIEYNPAGDYLAVGDKAGRIWIYEQSMDTDPSERAASGRPDPLEYKFYGQFQSHEPEFDYLKSLEIEEKINMIKWCKRQNDALMLLATNDKTIKLWKIYERKIKKLTDMNQDQETFRFDMGLADVRIPGMEYFDTVTAATPRRIFANAHTYHVNSISLNSDGETYISADDLRINLWHLDVSDQCCTIVDIKPENMEELTEVITSAQFHPVDCNLLLYATSRGALKIVDLRDSALCDSHSRIYEVDEDPVEKSFFSEIISSVSDVKFTPDGRHMISRDYLTVKVWDARSERAPIHTIPIHDHLQSKLVDLYENDCIFDKFECAPSWNNSAVVTGSYSENFMVYDWVTGERSDIHASKPMQRSLPANKARKENLDFTKKALHVAWHPQRDAVAVACLNNLYIYQH